MLDWSTLANNECCRRNNRNTPFIFRFIQFSDCKEQKNKALELRGMKTRGLERFQSSPNCSLVIFFLYRLPIDVPLVHLVNIDFNKHKKGHSEYKEPQFEEQNTPLILGQILFLQVSKNTRTASEEARRNSRRIDVKAKNLEQEACK